MTTAEGPTSLASSIAAAGLEWRRTALAEGDLCDLPLGVFWPLPAEASLTDLLLTATHDAVPPPPLSPDPGVLDVGAGAAKVMWVSLLLVLFCDIALAIKFRATSVYTTPINWQ